MLELKWDGKDEALKAAEETKTHLLEFDKNFSFGEKNSGNLIVQGDNLKVLKSLRRLKITATIFRTRIGCR